MSARSPHRRVVVGVDGSPSSTMAVRCRARGNPVRPRVGRETPAAARVCARRPPESLVRRCGRLDGVDVGGRGLEELTCQI